jgi:hypothetical protein
MTYEKVSSIDRAGQVKTHPTHLGLANLVDPALDVGHDQFIERGFRAERVTQFDQRLEEVDQGGLGLFRGRFRDLG